MLNLLLVSVLATAASKTEVQVNICDNFATLTQKFELQNWEVKQPEETYLIENKNFELYKKNWVFKVRLDRDQGLAEIILKNNQAENAPLDENMKCEYDLHGTAKKWACKMSSQISLADYTLLLNRHDYAGMLDAKQKDWLATEGLSLPSDLTATSAFRDQSYVTQVNGQKIELGVATNSNQTEFIEISARVKSIDEKVGQAQLLAYLQNARVLLCDEQGQLMTRLKLESYFGRP